jgi:hypothetical protein
VIFENYPYLLRLDPEPTLVSFVAIAGAFLIWLWAFMTRKPRIICSPAGLHLHWLDDPIAWSDIAYGRMVIAQGFGFGLNWIELRLKHKLEHDVEFNFDGFSLRSAIDIADEIELNLRTLRDGTPIWRMLDDTTIQISIGSLNVAPSCIVQAVNSYLEKPLTIS